MKDPTMALLEDVPSGGQDAAQPLSLPSARRGDAPSRVASEPLSNVELLVNRYYPRLLPSVKSCLAVFGAMTLAARTKPLSLILETPSGYGKTAVLQMMFPMLGEEGCDLRQYVYRSDKFTPRAFVSHAANIKSERLAAQDLLPKLQSKVLITKELAPIFRGRKEELTDNFSMLISVLDGKGFLSDSGAKGRRGYERNIIFNWIGATTPLPPETHRLMSQLGTRLLFYEVPAIEPTENELIAYAAREDAGVAERECQKAVNAFLLEFFERHAVAGVPAESISIPKPLLEQIVRWARFVATGRREIKYESEGTSWTPVSALQGESPYKLVNYFKELARGHALIHGRDEVEQSDLEMVAHVAISSVPGHVRPLVRQLRRSETIDTPGCMALCHVSDTSARRYMHEIHLLGVGRLLPGSPTINEPNEITLSENFRWLRDLET